MNSPCPICGSDAVTDEYSSLVTSSKGIDYQSGWVECTQDNCLHSSNGVTASGAETDNIKHMVYEQWEDHCERIRKENA